MNSLILMVAEILWDPLEPVYEGLVNVLVVVGSTCRNLIGGKESGRHWLSKT